MTVKVSTGARNRMLDTSPLRTLLNLGFIDIYSGPVPDSADDGIGGSNAKLCRISVNSSGTGLTLAAAAENGILTKNSGEVWTGVNLASGQATFYRHVAPTDTGATSATEVRLQGAVSTVGAEMNLSSVNLAQGATQTIDYYVVALPSQ